MDSHAAAADQTMEAQSQPPAQTAEPMAVDDAASSASVAAALPPPPPPPQGLSQLPSSLIVERILRSRALGEQTQFRVKWCGLLTETWVERESLFFHSESAAQHLSAFEQAVDDGLITAEGGWEEAAALEAAAQEAAKELGPDGTEAAIANAASSAATAAAAAAAVTAASSSKRGRGRGRGGQGSSRGRASKPRGRSSGPSDSRRGRSSSRGRGGKRKRSSRSVSPVFSLASSGDESSSGSDDLSGLDGAEAKAVLASRGLYEVERLVGDVWESGLHWFRVKWRGYDEYDNSWQRPEDLSGCAKELKAYFERKKAKQERALEAERGEKRKAKERGKRNKLVRQAGYTPAQADAMGAFTVEQWTTMHAKIQQQAAAAPGAQPALGIDLSAVGAISASAATPAAAAAAAASPSTSAPVASPSVAAAAASVPQLSPPPPAVLLSPEGDDSCVFPLHTFKTLAQAQQDQDEDDSDDERLPDAYAAPARQSSDYEAEVAADTASTCSTSSTASLLCHPAHKHAHDRAQCILAHDWYEQEHDQSTWLVLVKWKLKPVAECSWEPVDSSFLSGGNRRIVTTYLQTLTDKRTADSIRKNCKP